MMSQTIESLLFCAVKDAIYFQKKILRNYNNKSKNLKKAFKIHGDDVKMTSSIKFIRISIFSSFFVIKQVKNIKSGEKSAQNCAKKA